VRESSSVDLLLLRHGIAAERVSGIDHPDRPLTDRGMRRTQEVVRQLRKLEVQADALISSPYLRSRQTAELAIESGLAKSICLDSALEPGGDPWPLVSRVSGCCLLVGHEPDLSTLAATLIGAPAGSLRLRKAGYCHLSWPAHLSDPRGQAELQALLRPRLLLPRSV
tara:strand:+ start:506 stop:1006 length:501 start_codon:yes stop_codon:yes gene_type:complete